MLLLMLLLMGIFILFVILLCVRKRRNNNQEKYIQTLVRQAARYIYAAEQDEDPLIGVLHAYYAVGYLLALQDTTSEQTIYATTGANIRDVAQYAKKVQDEQTLRFVRLCPEYTAKHLSPIADLANYRIV